MADGMLQKARQQAKEINSSMFFQFFTILLAVISIVLFTSASFYESMLENVTAFSLQNSAKKAMELNLDEPGAADKINALELENAVTIEIYRKSNSHDSFFKKPVYYKSSYCILRSATDHHSDFPLLNFNYEIFMKDTEHTHRSLGDKTNAGRYTNLKSGYEYYALSQISDDGNMLYVAAIRYAIIEAQATAVNTAMIFILLVTFILLTLISYLFITRITKPLKDIRDVTTAMAETNSATLRIPMSHGRILTDTQETIASINYLYERLILTQEGLREKTEFLANQLANRDAEKKSREEFIASTSHELKTPISIIQGYAEGAKYLSDNPEELNYYCDTIIDECVRMNDLVVKMMTLSKLQHTKSVVFSDFSIRDFIDNRMELHERVFEKNNIKSENLVKDNIIGKGDKEKLQFVINNLLSNAISYISGENRIIRIRYEEHELFYRIFVFNSGQQIPQEELERLWESFYRNDPARSRNEGHFGLGLSIVKSVQDAHSQACGVDNADGGVEFWFDIMKSK